MNHVKIFFIFTMFCVITYSLQAQSTSSCDSLLVVSSNFIYKYEVTMNEHFLDSARENTNNAIADCNNSPNLILQKLQIYSYQHQYDEAIKYLEDKKDSLPYMPEMPFYWSNCKNRFYAMKYTYKGNLRMKKKYIRQIVKNIDGFLKVNQEALDSICINNDLTTITQNTLPWCLCYYYYYLGIIKDSCFIADKLYELKRKGYNQYFIDFIKETDNGDFLIFSGY